MPKPNELRFTLTINVTYDASTIGEPDLLVMELTRELDRVVGEGLLTPSRSEVVEEYDTEVRYAGDEEQGW